MPKNTLITVNDGQEEKKVVISDETLIILMGSINKALTRMPAGLTRERFGEGNQTAAELTELGNVIRDFINKG
jgi:hypothetical protein